ncbi:MAG: GNAT family protein [Caldilineaceae bacterium]|nr:GNAT family protein [Caldilineaceae bacterium]
MSSETSTDPRRPAYRIETERAVVRCWNPTDAGILLRAVIQSIDHLRDWMPWAKNEPTTLEEKIALLRHWRAEFDQDSDYTYGIFSPTEKEVWGGTGLHRRLTGNALEIGYWIRADLINRGLATEIAAALTKVAFSINKVDRVEIHCDPANVRSAAIPRKLGFTQEALLRRRATGSDGSPIDTMIWTLFLDQVGNSPVADVRVKAFDVLESEIHIT